MAPGGPGPRPPGTTTWLRGASLHGDRRKCRRRKRRPRPKTATVERREARVPARDAPRLTRAAVAPVSATTDRLRLGGAPPAPRGAEDEERDAEPGRQTRRGRKRGCAECEDQ
jgi:hypothetical protein